MAKNPSVDAGDTRDAGSILGSGRSPGVGNGNPLQYSCLENLVNREAWRATVHGVARVRHNLVTKQHNNRHKCMEWKGIETFCLSNPEF